MSHYCGTQVPTFGRWRRFILWLACNSVTHESDGWRVTYKFWRGKTYIYEVVETEPHTLDWQ